MYISPIFSCRVTNGFILQILSGITVLNNTVILITQSHLSIAQSSSRFKCLNMCTFIYTTPTCITEAHHLITQGFNNCYSLIQYQLTLIELVSMTRVNAKATPINDNGYSCHRTCLTNRMRSISHHIMPLIINSLGCGHTHTHKDAY